LALDHPAHDRVYIALAEAEGLRLVTADSTLVRTALGRYAGRVLGLTDAATGPDEL
jgi:predicted nucleic acid-binding protein